MTVAQLSYPKEPRTSASLFLKNLVLFQNRKMERESISVVFGCSNIWHLFTDMV